MDHDMDIRQESTLMNNAIFSSVPIAVMKAIKPTLQALAHPDLLKKCVH
jgi:hypothetical protein